MDEQKQATEKANESAQQPIQSTDSIH